jgi:4-hydroxy-tetrahydrodipicolinate reductase
MNIALVGYGKMGKQIEKVLKERNIQIVSTIDKFAGGVNHKLIDQSSMKDIDVAVDFSSTEGVIDRISQYVKYGVSVVMGTTGWYDRLEEAKKIVSDKIGFIWSGNFSLGVHIFFRLIKESAKILEKFDEYDVLGYELHHNEKKDSPSGTELMIGDILLSELSRKDKIVTEKLDRKIEGNEIHLSSVRGGYFPGTHTVLFDSLADTIELKHTARSREGFALGAVKVAQWLYGKKGFFSIDNYLESVIK